MNSCLSVNSLVDEVDGLCFELVGAVQVGQDEDLSSVFHGQTGAQRVLAHDLQSLQSILKERGEAGSTLSVFISIQVIFAVTVQLICANIISAFKITGKHQFGIDVTTLRMTSSNTSGF